MNGMTRKDVEMLCQSLYSDDWYDNPEMMGPEMESPFELWLRRDHKHDLAFRPLEVALEKGLIDAMYIQSGPLRAAFRSNRKFQSYRGSFKVSRLDIAGGKYSCSNYMYDRDGRKAS